MTSVKQIGAGRTADIFEINEDRILKLYKEGFSEVAIAEELMISNYVYDHGIRTPRPIEKTMKENRTGIIFERVSGISLLHAIRKKPFQVRKCSKIMAALHHQLHSREAASISRDQKAVLLHNIRHAPILSDTEKDKIKGYLLGLPDDHKLCHGDFHPDNILFDSEYWIIDWMTGMAGNPAGDIARTLLLLRYGTMPEGASKIFAAIIRYLRSRMENEYLAHYLKLSGKMYKEIDDWILPVAAARLRDGIPDVEKKVLMHEIRQRLEEIS